MSLKDRIDALMEPCATGSREEEKRRKINMLRHQLDRIMGHRQPVTAKIPPRNPSNLEKVLSGGVVETEDGPAFLVKYDYPLDHNHGYRALKTFLEAPTERLPLFAGAHLTKESLMENAIFMDVETTGLSGGAGTYAFLIGVGFFTKTGFQIHQYFMRDFHEEPGLLHLVSEFARTNAWLITFNGKSFDLNLLATRYIMNRKPFPFAPLPHWDLLRTSRSVFKLRIGSCSLSNIEENVLGLERYNDVPGYEIPSRYHRFIRDGNAKPLGPVFYHNRIDILSMVTLAAIFLQGIHQDEFVEELTPWEFLGLGKIMARTDVSRACDLWQHGLALADDEHIEFYLKKELGHAAKRAGDFTRAVVIWEEMMGSHLPDPYVHEELAKYFEHRVKDCGQALKLVEEALISFRHIDKWSESLEYRRNRLRRKIREGG